MSKQDKRPLRVIISGGGTGGHIFPAVAIANALRRRNPRTEILFVGALGRMEMERVPAAGYKIVGLPVAGFDRRRLWRNVGVVLKLIKSVRLAGKVIRDFQPDIAVGVGGYASGPVLKKAQSKGIPTLLQEQNSYAGVTNKMLAKGARKICVAYEKMERFFPEESIVMTGNPVRAEIVGTDMDRATAIGRLGMDPSKPLILVVGGSLGARTINRSISRCLDELTSTGAQVLWQTGKLYIEECQAIAEGKMSAQQLLSPTWPRHTARQIWSCPAPEQAPSLRSSYSECPLFWFRRPTLPKTISAKTPRHSPTVRPQ